MKSLSRKPLAAGTPPTFEIEVSGKPTKRHAGMFKSKTIGKSFGRSLRNGGRKSHHPDQDDHHTRPKTLHVRAKSTSAPPIVRDEQKHKNKGKKKSGSSRALKRRNAVASNPPSDAETESEISSFDSDSESTRVALGDSTSSAASLLFEIPHETVSLSSKHTRDRSSAMDEESKSRSSSKGK